MHKSRMSSTTRCKQTFAWRTRCDVDVDDREVGGTTGSDALRNLPATTMPSTAHEEYLASRRRGWAYTGSRALKVSFVEEHGVTVLGDQVEVLRQGTVSDKAELSCTNHMPRAVEVRGQQAGIRTTCGSWVPGQDLQLGLSGADRTGRSSRQAGETGGASGPRTRQWARSR